MENPRCLRCNEPYPVTSEGEIDFESHKCKYDQEKKEAIMGVNTLKLDDLNLFIDEHEVGLANAASFKENKSLTVSLRLRYRVYLNGVLQFETQKAAEAVERYNGMKLKTPS